MGSPLFSFASFVRKFLIHRGQGCPNVQNKADKPLNEGGALDR